MTQALLAPGGRSEPSVPPFLQMDPERFENLPDGPLAASHLLVHRLPKEVRNVRRPGRTPAADVHGIAYGLIAGGVQAAADIVEHRRSPRFRRAAVEEGPCDEDRLALGTREMLLVDQVFKLDAPLARAPVAFHARGDDVPENRMRRAVRSKKVRLDPEQDPKSRQPVRVLTGLGDMIDELAEYDR